MKKKDPRIKIIAIRLSHDEMEILLVKARKYKNLSQMIRDHLGLVKVS